MRLFVAVEIGPAVVQALVELTGRLRSRVARHAPHARVSWATPERMHLTLAFIGEVAEPVSARVTAVLRERLPGEPFQMTCAGLGAFPPRGAPRVLWVGVSDGRERVLQLEREVAARLQAAGMAADPRPYHPHLTLGRVREPAGLRTAALFEGLGAGDLGPVDVEAITLFESRPSPRGPTYVALQRTPIATPGAGGLAPHG